MKVNPWIFFSYDDAYIDYIKSEHWEEFIKNETDHNRFAKATKCNYFEQSSCLTTMQEKFDQTQFSQICLPKCHHTTIHQQGIFVSRQRKSVTWTFCQYKTMDPDQVNYFRRVIKKNKPDTNISEVGEFWSSALYSII